MSSKSLSNISAEATEQTNTANELTPILEIQPTSGTRLILLNGVERGQQVMGLPIFFDPKDGNGTDLPADTRMVLEHERPTDDSPNVVSEPKENIRAYRSLSLTDQQNEEYVDRTKHVLKGNAQQLVVGDDDKLYVSIESSDTIDWTYASLTFDENAVREV